MLNNEIENVNIYIIGLDDLCAQLKIIDKGSGILVKLFGNLSLQNIKIHPFYALLSLLLSHKEEHLITESFFLP